MSEKREVEFRFEDSLRKVEEIVEQIEQGDMPIDDLTVQVDVAAELLKKCRLHLRKTEEDLEKTLTDLDNE